jgi:hypothetical protein
MLAWFQMENNIVFVVDYSKMRHCRLASSMAAVLMLETRLQGLGCNKDLEIAMNLRYTAYSMMLLEQENAILQLLVDEAPIVMRLKTSLLDFQLCAQGGQ